MIAATVSPETLRLTFLLAACLCGTVGGVWFAIVRAKRQLFLKQAVEAVENAAFFCLSPAGRIRWVANGAALFPHCRGRACHGKNAAELFAEKEPFAKMIAALGETAACPCPDRPAPDAAAARETFTATPPGGEPFPVGVTLFPRVKTGRTLLLRVEDLRPLRNAEALLRAYRSGEQSIFRHLNERAAEPRRNAFFNGGNIAVLTTPRKEEMAGDFIHLCRADERICDITLCDVKGEGFYAALLGASVRGDLNQVLTGLILKENPPALPAVDAIVTALKATSLERFRKIGAEGVVCYARFNFAERRLDWAALGDAPILHWQNSQKKVAILHGRETQEALRSGTAPFASNDLFLIPSEMLFAMEDPAGQRFSVDRLAAILEETAPAWSELPDPHQQLMAGIMAFAAQEELPPGCTATFAVVGITPEEETIVREHIKIPFDFLPGDLPVMREAAMALLTAADFPPMRNEMIYLALHEAMVNIIEQRDRQGRHDLSGYFEALRYDAMIVWRFVHNLPFFMPIRIKDPKSDGTQDHGYGLFIIDQIADQVLYNRAADGRSLFEMLTLKESGEEAF